MFERDELERRVRANDVALATIEAETEHALRHPETAVTVLCRIAAVARGALRDSEAARAPESALQRRRA